MRPPRGPPRRQPLRPTATAAARGGTCAGLLRSQQRSQSTLHRRPDLSARPRNMVSAKATPSRQLMPPPLQSTLPCLIAIAATLGEQRSHTHTHTAPARHSRPRRSRRRLQTVGPLAAAAAGQGLSVVVASRNAVKINAVAAALRAALPGAPHKVAGADSASGMRRCPRAACSCEWTDVLPCALRLPAQGLLHTIGTRAQV